MGPITLSLALYAALIGTMAFGVSIYVLVLIKSKKPEEASEPKPFQSRVSAKEMDRGLPHFGEISEEDMGMPETFDPDRIGSMNEGILS